MSTITITLNAHTEVSFAESFDFIAACQAVGIPDDTVFESSSYTLSATAEMPVMQRGCPKVETENEIIEELQAHAADLHAELDELSAEHAELQHDWGHLLELAEQLTEENMGLREMGDIEPAPGMSVQVLHLAYPSTLTGQQLAVLLEAITQATDAKLATYGDENDEDLS